jgi:hypothetical protein
MVIVLPSHVVETDLPGFLAMLWRPVEDETLDFDFTRVVFYIPAAITILIARIDHARRRGINVRFLGLKKCKSFRYLQRIDFFDQLQIELLEDFERHDQGTDMVPLREVTPGTVGLRDDPVVSELAACIANSTESDCFLLSQYSLGEIVANLKQHAGEKGFVCGQYLPKNDLVHIGIADSGIGIRESFRQTSAPHYNDAMSDGQVLEFAMARGRSSKAHLKTAYGESANKGIGLTITRFLVSECYGIFFLASGTAWWLRNGIREPVSGTLAHGAGITGTVLSLSFNRFQVTNYLELRQRAWQGQGLTLDEASPNLFT